MSILQIKKDLTSYLGDPAVKAKYLNRVQTHRAADEIIHGDYGRWENDNGKGCAVGCTLHSSNHLAAEDEIGVPVQLMWIQDGLFERLSRPDDVIFPEQFLDAIPVGVNLYPAYWKFVHWVLTNDKCGLVTLSQDEKAKKAFSDVADYYQMAIDGKDIDKDEFDKFINALALALALALDLALALALDLDLALALALALDLDLALALALDLDLALALALALDLALPLLWRDKLLELLRESN